jgi:intracellular multiplication protein IcmE
MMSGALSWLGRPRLALGRFAGRRIFNSAGDAGPRRLAILTALGLAVLGLVVVVAATGRHAPTLSKDARMKPVDPLPGGLNSTPEQDALARHADDTRAQAALRTGVSFTPPMAPSVSVLPPPPQVEQAAPQAAVRHQAAFVGRRSAPPRPATVRAVFAAPMAQDPAAAAQPRSEAQPIRVATPGDPKADEAYARQISDLFSQWGGRAPRTDVVLPPADGNGDAAPDDPEPAPSASSPRAGSVGKAGDRRDPKSSTSRNAPAPASSAPAAAAAEILIPAGRGVYAHPILAVNSDATSPVVMQADSGPIAGDRMIGTFAKQADRLVVHINTVIHQGQNIGVDGLVVAPETMEAGVAFDVDQHYLTRFLLPAAAAFVQGLGQAIATTSNTAAVLSPFGGAAYSTHLNLNQQLGVAAGAAAGQIGSVLNQAAPKGPTVSLDANVAVGVMFLSNVTLHRGS